MELVRILQGVTTTSSYGKTTNFCVAGPSWDVLVNMFVSQERNIRYRVVNQVGRVGCPALHALLPPSFIMAAD